MTGDTDLTTQDNMCIYVYIYVYIHSCAHCKRSEICRILQALHENILAASQTYDFLGFIHFRLDFVHFR